MSDALVQALNRSREEFPSDYTVAVIEPGSKWGWAVIPIPAEIWNDKEAALALGGELMRMAKAALAYAHAHEPVDVHDVQT